MPSELRSLLAAAKGALAPADELQGNKGIQY